MRQYTNSELKTWKRCERKWWLTYNRRLKLQRENPVGAAALGTLVHAALQVLYTPGDERDPVALLRERVADDILGLQTIGPETVDKQKEVRKQGDLAAIMVEGYLEWLEVEGADQGLHILGAEREVTVPIPGMPGHAFLGKIDVRVQREEDGAVLALDHKTVQNFSDRTRLAHMDEQLLYYHMIEYLAELDGQLEGRADGSLLNMLRKVKRTATATPPFYSRLEVHHNVEQLRAHWDHVMSTISRIQDAEVALSQGVSHQLVVTPNVTKDCTWDCPFKPICPMFDDGSDVDYVIGASYVEGDPLAYYDETVL